MSHQLTKLRSIVILGSGNEGQHRALKPGTHSAASHVFLEPDEYFQAHT